MKLDIAGAFNSVSWIYLLEVRTYMDFGSWWCDIICLLWATASA